MNFKINTVLLAFLFSLSFSFAFGQSTNKYCKIVPSENGHLVILHPELTARNADGKKVKIEITYHTEPKNGFLTMVIETSSLNLPSTVLFNINNKTISKKMEVTHLVHKNKTYTYTLKVPMSKEDLMFFIKATNGPNFTINFSNGESKAYEFNELNWPNKRHYMQKVFAEVELLE
jgi:hypothetical protein